MWKMETVLADIESNIVFIYSFIHPFIHCCIQFICNFSIFFDEIGYLQQQKTKEFVIFYFFLFKFFAQIAQLFNMLLFFIYTDSFYPQLLDHSFKRVRFDKIQNFIFISI